MKRAFLTVGILLLLCPVAVAQPGVTELGVSFYQTSPVTESEDQYGHRLTVGGWYRIPDPAEYTCEYRLWVVVYRSNGTTYAEYESGSDYEVPSWISGAGGCYMFTRYGEAPYDEVVAIRAFLEVNWMHNATFVTGRSSYTSNVIFHETNPSP
jgi:hypothetical protein